jgi:hypothetical protein
MAEVPAATKQERQNAEREIIERMALRPFEECDAPDGKTLGE